MENKIKGAFKEEEDKFGYKEAIVATGNIKACVYKKDDENSVPFCYLGVERATLGFKKREDTLK